MPTQEERLSTVEYSLDIFKTETLKAYRDMAFQVTMLMGLSEDTVKRLATMKMQVDQRFDAVDRRFDAVELRLDSVDQRLDSMDRRLTTMENKLDQVLTVLSKLTSRLEYE